MDLILPKKEYLERLSICDKCENKTRFHTCALCGCLIVVKAKLASSNCPQSKWPNEEK